MSSVKEIIEGVFRENEIEYEFIEGAEAFTAEFKAENLFVDVRILYAEKYFVVLSKIPLLVDSKKESSVCELLLRINDRIVSGSFDYSYDDRSITFRSGLNLINLELTPDIVENLFFNTVISVDHHIKVITQVLTSETSPLDAFKAFEDMEKNEPTTTQV